MSSAFPLVYTCKYLLGKVEYNYFLDIPSFCRSGNRTILYTTMFSTNSKAEKVSTIIEFQSDYLILVKFFAMMHDNSYASNDEDEKIEIFAAVY